jgi:glucokinase
VVRPGGNICGCGAHGCLEAEASAAAVGRQYTALTGTRVTAAQVAGLARDGDPAAGKIWQEAVQTLADGLITAQALFDVEVIVLGGGLAEAGDLLLDPLRDAIRAGITFHREPHLARTTLGDQAGCVGAALLALGLPRAA